MKNNRLLRLLNNYLLKLHFTSFYQKKIFFLIAASFFFVSDALTQPVVITGKVQDSTNKAVPSATVLIKNTDAKIVLFSFSDTKGSFKFEIPDSLKNTDAFIEVSALGYSKEKMKLESSKQYYLFVLKVLYNELPEVSLTSRQKIKSSGDTISYDVKSFEQAEDRSIGDVIKRMPGMTVADDGSITFNGKRINNLIIQSDDLMNGRYGLATKTISKEMIKKIEVIQHFQPISILKDKVFSDDVVVNLVLKDENAIKLSGQTQIGVGLPNLINLATNLITLSKKIKMLNSIKYNNSGEDYRFDFKDLTSVNNFFPKELLSDAVLENPGLPNKYIYRNNSFSVSANNLYNTKDSTQLRANIRYFFDKNNLSYNSYTENYILNDTVIYKENQSAKRMPYNFDAGFSLLRNKNAYYLKDQLQLNLKGYTNNSKLNFNDDSFPQAVSLNLKNISNNFQWIPSFLKKDIITFNWQFSYYNAPQNLNVGKGIDSSILNNSIPYSSLHQFAEIPTFVNNLAVNYYINNNKSLQQSYELGTENKWQKLNSTTYLTQLNGSTNAYTGDYGNAIDWKQNSFFVKTNYFVKKEYWRINLSVPFVLQQIKYTQDEYALNASRAFFAVNPELKGEYYFNGENSLLFLYKYNNSFGEIEDIYKGIIVNNFKQITNNEAFIRELQSNEINLQYKMNRSLKMLFLNIAFQYKNSLLNAVPAINYTNTIQQTIYIPLKNTQSSLLCFANISKYLFPIKTKVGIDFGFSNQNTEQYINTRLLPFETNSFNAGFTADCKLIEFASVSYSGTANWITSKEKNTQNNIKPISSKVTLYNQNISLTIVPPRFPLFITMGSTFQINESSFSQGNNYFFSDINLRYSSKKLRTDFEFNIDNIFNVKTYNIFSTTSNQLVASNYELRGRMVMLKAIFNF